MPYRICKAFEVESGHMLMKHPSLCKFPHGHTRSIEVVMSAETLDASDMVCDFKTIKLALKAFIDRFDHAMAINSKDPILQGLPANLRERVILFEGVDPTTEVIAKHIFDHLTAEIAAGKSYRDEHGGEYRFPRSVTIERVRVGETSSTWAEYSRS